MKKITTIFLAALLSLSLVSAAGAFELALDLQDGANASAETAEMEAIEHASPDGASVQGEAVDGESQDGASPAGESPQGESPDGESAGGESGSDGMEGGQAASDVAPEGSINISSGEKILEGEEISVWEGSAIQNSGDSVLVAKDCLIIGDTETPTAPLAGNPGNLLVAGNIRTTLALGQAQSYYINSTIISRNWAALSTDGAKPALAEGEKELSLYAYGTEAITQDGGYGAYSDLFCNLYVYGSHIQSAEIGIISGTYGAVTIGASVDGEANEDLAAYLTDEDLLEADTESLVEGGRNALMIHSVNLPPYWEYEGYSQEELPLYSTPVYVSGSMLATNLELDLDIAYDEQKQAYIDHTAGSVVLIKSTNVDMELVNSSLIADEAGTGYAIQTTYNNDTMFMNAVPDGEEYPGISVAATGSYIEGSIAHEDYQRDFYILLDDSILIGAINVYDCAHWNEAAQAEGFTDYALDETYETPHGLIADLEHGSTWTVTAPSTLTGLIISEDSVLEGVITVDGEIVEGAGEYYGEIVVNPA